MHSIGKLFVVGSLLAGCKTTGSRLHESAPSNAASSLWQAHIKLETTGKKIQPECMPRFYPASSQVEHRGMVMFFHGFTACPQQYFAISELLAAKGYDVYLPLMPGQSREPFDGPKGQDDNHKDLPSTENKAEYKPGDDENDRLQFFVQSMNEMARQSKGEKILAGLSGGGGLATGAVEAGPDIWTRLLLYAPYYKNPGISGVGSAVLDKVMPGFVNDWGPECRANRAVEGGRAGLCSLTIGSIRAMTNYGVNAAQRVASIKIPVQFVGAEADPTADNGAIHAAFQKIATNASICLYPKGVPHSMINPKSDAPKLDPYWVPALQADSLAFIMAGQWFPSSGAQASKADYNLPICRNKL